MLRPLLFVLASVATAACACSFQYDPVSLPHYYRAEGWNLPGIQDDPKAVAELTGLPSARSVPGFQAHVIRHERPFIVQFPAQEFLLNGSRQKMRAAQWKAGILKWVTQGKTVAYSYGLIPVSAHREKGKWVVDVAAGCIFDATFVDDSGDGVFRLLVPGPFSQDLIPAWIAKVGN